MKILLIEDEKITRVTLRDTLKKKGHTVTACETGKEGLEKIEESKYDLILTDLRLPTMSGIDILKRVKERDPATFVIVMTAYGTIQNAVEALKLGAYDYLTKPFSYDELFILLEKIHDYNAILKENIQLKKALSKTRTIIGTSNEIKMVLETVDTVADGDYTVLIYGETGTGKELITNELHKRSSRKDKPLVKINCAALSETLLESELFGHEKGAYTGAVKTRKGRFELADGGTIFLDEVDDIPLSMQVKLLHVLQEREFERVGGTTTISVDVRVIAAAKTDLGQKIEEGSFRSDLYYRLNVVPIHLPPLREHKEDILLLVEHFIRIHDMRGKIESISPDCVEELMRYDWPGNIRELENSIQQMIALSKNETLDISDIPQKIKTRSSSAFELRQWKDPNEESVSLENSLQKFEQKMLTWALKKTSKNKSQAAKILQLSRSTFRSKLMKYGLEDDELS